MRRKVVAGITLLGIAAVADLIWVKTRSHAPDGAGAAVVPARPVLDEVHGIDPSCARPDAQPGSHDRSSRYDETRKSAICK
jgi:hypothetical protein